MDLLEKIKILQGKVNQLEDLLDDLHNSLESKDSKIRSRDDKIRELNSCCIYLNFLETIAYPIIFSECFKTNKLIFFERTIFLRNKYFLSDDKEDIIDELFSAFIIEIIWVISFFLIFFFISLILKDFIELNFFNRFY